MHRIIPIALLLAACSAGDDTTDTGTSPTADPDGWENHAFETGTTAGCSTDIAWNTWNYDKGDAVATIVFSHGRTEYTDKYHHMVEEMQDQPWNWVMWDQYGHGRSGGIRAHATDLTAEHACDLGVIVDEFTGTDLPVIQVSASTGGLVSALWLQQNPGRTAAVAFGSPLFGLKVEGYTEAAACQLAGFSIMGGDYESLADTDYPNPRPACEEWQATHDCDLYEQFRTDPLTEIGGATWGWLNAVCEGLDVLRLDPSSIDAPTIMLRAGDDNTVDTSSFDEICDNVGGGCEIVEFPGDWHEIWHELDRDVAQQKLIDLVESSI